MPDDDKTTFEKKMDAKLEEMDARLKLLRAKADQAAAETEASGRSAMEALQSKRDDIAQKLHKYKEATGSAATELQSGVERAADEFSKSLDSAEQDSQ